MSNELIPVNKQLPAPATASIAAAEEVKCLFLAAMQCPRNMSQVKERVIEACHDRDLATDAMYSYRKGGTLVEGPSIDLIQEIACIYGRIKSGWEVVEEGHNASKVRAYAIDIENLHPDERTFIVKHEISTKNGIKPLTDPRDIYELVANLAQRRKRSCIEALIPKTIINAAIRQVNDTLKAGSDKPLEKRAQELATRFNTAFGVTQAQIEKFIGAKIIGMTETQYVQLIAVGKSIKDGAPAGQFFDMKEPAPAIVEPEKTSVETEGKKRGRKPKETSAAADESAATIQSDIVAETTLPPDLVSVEDATDKTVEGLTNIITSFSSESEEDWGFDA